MTKMQDESGNPLVGYVNLGTHLVPRAKLVKKHPDFERFERCLADALIVDAYMTKHDGAIPTHLVNAWSDTYCGDVADTLREIGELTLVAAEDLEQWFDSRDPDPPEAA